MTVDSLIPHFSLDEGFVSEADKIFVLFFIKNIERPAALVSKRVYVVGPVPANQTNKKNNVIMDTWLLVPFLYF